MRRVFACAALAVASSAAHGQAIDNAARGLAAQAQATANAAIPKAQIGTPNGVAGLGASGTVPTAQLPYVSVTARAPTAADDGSSGTPCATGMTWTYGGNTWQQQACGAAGAGQAHWQLMQSPGLLLDAVAAAGNTSGHFWGTFKARSGYSGSDLVLSNLAGTPQTVTIGFAGNLGDYVSMDAFLSQYPENYTVIPDAFSGSIFANMVTATTVYDQTDTSINTAYNLGAPTGAFQVSPTGGTGYTNSTVVTLTTNGCTNTIVPPQVSTFVTGGVPNPVSLTSTTSSQLTSVGECAPGGGSFNSAQTEASHTGTEGAAASAWTIGQTYNMGPVWLQSPGEKIGVFRTLNFNSYQAQLAFNGLSYDKTLVNTSFPWTPSNATVITVMRLSDGNMTATIYGSLADGQTVQNNLPSATTPAEINLSNAKGVCQLAVSSTPTIMAVTWNSSGTPRISCQDGNTFNQGFTGGSSISAVTGFEIGGTSSNNTLKGSWAGTAVFTTALTQNQLNAAILSIVMQGQIPLQYDKIVSVNGDSNFTTGSITGDNSVTSLIDNLHTPAKVYDMAIHGQVACSGNLSASNHFTYDNTYTYSPSVRKMVFFDRVGPNDIVAGVPATTVEPCIQNVVQQARAFYSGSGNNNISVVWGTGGFQCVTLNGGSTALTQTLALQSYVIANSPQSSGGLGADYISNMINDPVLTGGTYSNIGGQVSATASAYCSIPASGNSSYPNANSPEGGHQTKEFTDQWVPFWTTIDAALAN